MQFPSAAENKANDTSMAVICSFAVRNLRPSSWHRSELAARVGDAALNTAITTEHRKTTWRYKSVPPPHIYLQSDTSARLCQAAERPCQVKGSSHDRRLRA